MVGGGALMDLGYHAMDLFRYFAGECKVVYSRLDHKLNLPAEDSAIAVLESTAESTLGIVNVGWYQSGPPLQVDFRTILHGNAGYLSSESLIPSNIYRHAAREALLNGVRKVLGGKIRPLSYMYFAEAWYKELDEFFRCIAKGTEMPVSVEDGLRTVNMIQQAYALAKTTQDRKASSL
jgi:predicted dehydrogenase